MWIAGHKPGWLSEHVGHIPVAQGGTKWANSTANLLAACRHPQLTDQVVYLNDDFFLLRHIDMPPVEHRGPIDGHRDHLRGHRSGQYLRGLLATADLLRSWGHTQPLSYELHVPLLIDRHLMAAVLDQAAPARVHPLHKRTLYGNVARIGGVQAVDVKVRGDGAWDQDRWCVSTNDQSFAAGRVGRWLRARYPHPTRYEKG